MSERRVAGGGLAPGAARSLSALTQLLEWLPVLDLVTRPTVALHLLSDEA